MKSFHAQVSLFLLLLAVWTVVPVCVSADELNLPDLGDSVAGIISPQQERDMGQAWLRLYRSRVPEYSDPQLTDYLENILVRIARYSELEDKHLDLIVVNNPQINAFAAPGGIIGVHSGLFLYTQSESELAGVLSHELAHLSQHHFARGVEKSRQNMLPTLAGLLAGMVLLATAKSDAGMAAIATTQAASLQSSLHFSRQNEQEADNIGMKTLVAAGFDPTAMTTMFEHMLDATRFMGQRVPEYLLDHPVTEQRIAESRARTTGLPAKHYDENIEFQFMRARVRLHHEENPQMAIKRFQSEIEGKTISLPASRYGLALAYIAAEKFNDAKPILDKLQAEFPDVAEIPMAQAELELARNNTSNAGEIVNRILQTKPKYYPARLLQASILNHEGKYGDAEKILYLLSLDRPNDAEVWYELAETRGQSGNIPGVHIARAEFFILNGIYDKARQQLNYAIKLLANNHVEIERIKQRLLDIQNLENMSLQI